MTGSSSAAAPGGEPFDISEFARATVSAIEYADEYADYLEDRVIRLEEIIAARWPRSWFLRLRLGRELRASVARHDDTLTSHRDFRSRRLQAADEHLTAPRHKPGMHGAEPLA